MKPIKFLPVMALIAILSFSCSTETVSNEITDDLELQNPPSAKEIEIEILELINQHRIELGLNTLTGNTKIKSVAYSHTDYMVEVNSMSHDHFYQRRNSLIVNADAQEVSENVAYAYSSAHSVVQAWLKSEGHKANIEGDFTDFDVSAEQNAQGKWYFTNIFIKK